MKILVIFTGGTIGSTVGENFISLDDSKKYALIDNFNKNTNLKVDFDIETPYSILSENLSGEELTTLCKLVESKVSSGYDGIIVTHGTDTIQYTASALAYTVKTQIPILLVSANYPLDNDKSNGNDNFLGAVEFINQCKTKGVFVSYRNISAGDVEFFPANRILTHLEGKHKLYSIDGIPCALYAKPNMVISSALNFANSVIVFEEATPITGKGAIGSVEFVSNPKILFINSHPADSFDYNLKGYNAVLIKPYHSGTLDTANKNFTEFCKKAKENNIPIFIPNVNGGISYESTKTFNELSLTVLPYSAIPAIYVKIWIAISIGADIKEFVLEELNGEFLNKTEQELKKCKH